MCSKSLIEARDEITEMKRKLKIMSHQIDQLKEEIAGKVQELNWACVVYTVTPCSLPNTGACLGEEQCRADPSGA